jgi:Dolichyl-phosphate-mannose-protein mannosyltransferase
MVPTGSSVPTGDELVTQRQMRVKRSDRTSSTRARARRLNGTVVLLAGAVVVLLSAFASGYGYHRDELYFVAAGQHLDWAYPDQGLLTPLIARAMTAIAPNSLIVLRLPSALAAGGTVLLTGLLAREFGGGRRAQAVGAACAAVASIVLITGHLLSTATFDLTDWAAVTWLAVRAVRTEDERLWLLVGAVLGVGLLNKPLPACLGAGLCVGVAIAGPRRLLRSPYVWSGAALALALCSPWILWQAAHNWPQIDVARSLANGHSVSSQPRWAILPFQTLLVSPPLALVWIVGLVALFREPRLRDMRFLAWAWVALAVVFVAGGGKPYYLAGLLPALIGAGAVRVDGWLDHGRALARKALLCASITLSGAIDATIALPILPAREAGPVIAVNKDAGETIGWPELAQAVARVYRQLPHKADAVIFTANYGEAGAIDRYGPALGLPSAYSGHNAFGLWGPPPNGRVPVVVVGLAPGELVARFASCTVASRIHNHAGADNEEQGELVTVCRRPMYAWSREWASLRHLG